MGRASLRLFYACIMSEHSWNAKSERSGEQQAQTIVSKEEREKEKMKLHGLQWDAAVLLQEKPEKVNNMHIAAV